MKGVDADVQGVFRANFNDLSRRHAEEVRRLPQPKTNARGKRDDEEGRDGDEGQTTRW